MNIFKDKDKRNGLIGTILFHAILLLIFIFYGLTYQYPPPLQGIRINFGTSDQGMGDVQPIKSSAEESVEQVEEVVPVATVEEAHDTKTVTQEVVETISVPKETEAEKQEKIRKEEQQKKEEEFKQKMTDVWKNRESANEGETGQPGDQGSKDGALDATSHVGGPDGTGKGNYYLLGRTMLTTIKATYNEQEEGKVVVDIIVSKEGNVIRATIARETTIITQSLRNKALAEAKKARFSPAKDIYTPEEQKGKIIVYFTP